MGPGCAPALYKDKMKRVQLQFDKTFVFVYALSFIHNQENVMSYNTSGPTTNIPLRKNRREPPPAATYESKFIKRK